MGRCIIVLGTGRSGTSAIAGVLASLGVDMGSEFVPESPSNPYGTFEDIEFFDTSKEILGGEVLPEGFFGPLVEARKDKLIWGVKVPTMAFTAHYLIPLLDDVRIIYVRRPRAECINSYMRAYSRGRRQAIDWFNDTIRAVAAQLLEFNGPVLDVEFSDLLSDPEGVVSEVQSFIFEDWENLEDSGYLAPRFFSSAVKHIWRGPRKIVEGWGNIALGVRIHHHPEPNWVKSWSALLSGGLRKNDTVLMPQVGMPAHWAANALAHEFMKNNPNQQTLLLIDDDMVFTPDALHVMREHRENWEYDVVMAHAVRKQEEFPTPVVMWHKGDMPEPDSLKGDFFESPPPEMRKGDVLEVDAVGLAFTLIKRRVLEGMISDEWGLDNTYFFRYGPGKETEDIPFSRDCRRLKFRLAIDSAVRVKHIGESELGWDDWQNVLKRGMDNG